MSSKLEEIGLVSPQLAEAKAIDNLSNPKGVTNKTLSNISMKDIPRINLITGIYHAVGWKWVNDIIDDELQVRCSANRKGTRGRDDLVTICMNQEENKGVLDNMKEKISSFFRSGS